MTAKPLTQKELDAIEQWWKPHSPAHPFLAQETANPSIVINHLLELVKELKGVLEDITKNARHGPLCGELDGQWTPGVYTAQAALSRLNGEEA